MRLQRQPPMRMRHNVGDRFARILARAGLQEKMVGFDGGVPFFNVGASLKNHFHLVGGGEHGRAALFGRYGHPVDVGGQRTSALGLDGNLSAFGV